MASSTASLALLAASVHAYCSQPGAPPCTTFTVCTCLTLKRCWSKVYSLSVLCFTGSVAAPDREVLRVEATAWKKLTSGPSQPKCGSLGRNSAQGLTSWGIRVMSVAARFRVGSGSTTLFQDVTAVQEARDLRFAILSATQPSAVRNVLAALSCGTCNRDCI